MISLLITLSSCHEKATTLKAFRQIRARLRIVYEANQSILAFFDYNCFDSNEKSSIYIYTVLQKQPNVARSGIGMSRKLIIKYICIFLTLHKTLPRNSTPRPPTVSVTPRCSYSSGSLSVKVRSSKRKKPFLKWFCNCIYIYQCLLARC